MPPPPPTPELQAKKEGKNNAPHKKLNFFYPVDKFGVTKWFVTEEKINNIFWKTLLGGVVSGVFSISVTG